MWGSALLCTARSPLATSYTHPSERPRSYPTCPNARPNASPTTTARLAQFSRERTTSQKSQKTTVGRPSRESRGTSRFMHTEHPPMHTASASRTKKAREATTRDPHHQAQPPPAYGATMYSAPEFTVMDAERPEYVPEPTEYVAVVPEHIPVPPKYIPESLHCARNLRALCATFRLCSPRRAPRHTPWNEVTQTAPAQESCKLPSLHIMHIMHNWKSHEQRIGRWPQQHTTVFLFHCQLSTN